MAGVGDALHAAWTFTVVGAGGWGWCADAHVQGLVAGEAFGADAAGAAGEEAGARDAGLVRRAFVGGAALDVRVVHAEAAVTELASDALAVFRACLRTGAVDAEEIALAAVRAGDALGVWERCTDGTQTGFASGALVIVDAERTADAVDADAFVRAVAAALTRGWGRVSAGAFNADVIGGAVAVGVTATGRFAGAADAAVCARAVTVRGALLAYIGTVSLDTRLVARALGVRAAGALSGLTHAGAAYFIGGAVTVAAAAGALGDAAVIAADLAGGAIRASVAFVAGREFGAVACGRHALARGACVDAGVLRGAVTCRRTFSSAEAFVIAREGHAHRTGFPAV